MLQRCFQNKLALHHNRLSKTEPCCHGLLINWVFAVDSRWFMLDIRFRICLWFRVGSEILEACGCVYVKEIFLQILEPKFFFLETYSYVIFFKKIGGTRQMYHLAWYRAGSCLSMSFIRSWPSLSLHLSYLHLLYSSNNKPY